MFFLFDRFIEWMEKYTEEERPWITWARMVYVSCIISAIINVFIFCHQSEDFERDYLSSPPIKEDPDSISIYRIRRMERQIAELQSQLEKFRENEKNSR